jgi:hypothetical protein
MWKNENPVRAKRYQITDKEVERYRRENRLQRLKDEEARKKVLTDKTTSAYKNSRNNGDAEQCGEFWRSVKSSASACESSILSIPTKLFYEKRI